MDGHQFDISARIAPLVRGYVDNCGEKIKQLRGLADLGDFDGIRRLAHNLHGTGASFGVPEVSRIGGELESIAQSRDEDRVTRTIEALAQAVSEARSALDR